MLFYQARLTALISILFALSSSALAVNEDSQQLHFGAPLKATAFIAPQHPPAMANKNFSTSKRTLDVYFMNIQLTAQQKESISAFRQIRTPLANPSPNSKLPSSIQLGMGKVPVLNQGDHGSCATFATTAAIDALLNKGDYISQLAILELGSYLNDTSYFPDGWDGSMARFVLSRLHEFGIVKKTDDNEYPLEANSIGKPLSPENYHAQSEDINGRISWYPILTDSNRLSWAWSAFNTESQQTLDNIKTALATIPNKFRRTNARAIFGTLVPINHCGNGACAAHHVANDTWALTNSILDAIDHNFGGHIMIITGYDDNATAIDNEGKVHTGLLTLRNSWGDKAGDHGDYYMTYDFFRAFVLEVQIVAIAY